MSRNWETHLDEVEDLGEYGTEAIQNYFSASKDKVFQRFDEEFERYENTESSDIPLNAIENMENEDTLEYLLNEMKIADQAEAYAEVYREMFDVIKEDFGAPQTYAEDMRQLKEERDRTERNVDKHATLDFPDNVVVEAIEEELDPILEESKAL